MKQYAIFLFIVFYSCAQNENSTYNKPYQLNDGIKTATLTDVGIDEKIIQAMNDSITAGVYTNIHSVLILRNNKLVYENYWPGKDENRETGFHGLIVHHRDSLHDIRSISKSITGASVMIALSQGKIKSLDQHLFDFFPELAKYNVGLKKQITIRHLLTMTAGLNWRDDLSFSDSLKHTTIASAIEFILRQPVVDTPGTKFYYSDGCAQILAVIVEKATGMDIEKFTAKYLFEPIGITTYQWTREKNGLISAWAGLRMRSRDVLKFGMLYIQQGKWEGKQIIPANLVNESIDRHIYTEEPYGYGYQFWTLIDTLNKGVITTVEATGNGGQKIEINKNKNLVLVITAGNYDTFNLRKASYDIYLDFVYPAIIK